MLEKFISKLGSYIKYYLFAGTHGTLFNYFAQVKPDPHWPVAAAGHAEAIELVVVATPTAPGTEMSFSDRCEQHCGQTGGGASLLKTIFSYLVPQIAQRYS
jgi:hypothetical protein